MIEDYKGYQDYKNNFPSHLVDDLKIQYPQLSTTLCELFFCIIKFEIHKGIDPRDSYPQLKNIKNLAKKLLSEEIIFNNEKLSEELKEFHKDKE